MKTLTKQEEKELLIRLIEGDAKAFETIYFAYVERVYYFACRYLDNSGDAEEIVQEVFTKMWENRKNINVEMSFSGYLLTTTKNTIFNEHRKKVNHQTYCTYIIQYLQRHMHNVEREIEYKDLMELVNNTVETLPAKRREIFKLGRIQGLSYKEISKKLSITEKTIETHMRLALRDIKRVLEPLLEKIL